MHELSTYWVLLPSPRESLSTNNALWWMVLHNFTDTEHHAVL